MELCTFGERLRYLRNEKNFNQAEFGEILGDLMNSKRVSSSAVGAYERNEREPTYLMLSAISKYFGVSLDFLLCNSDERLTVDKFTKKSSYKLQELFEKYNIYLNGTFLDKLPYVAGATSSIGNLSMIVVAYVNPRHTPLS